MCTTFWVSWSFEFPFLFSPSLALAFSFCCILSRSLHISNRLPWWLWHTLKWETHGPGHRKDRRESVYHGAYLLINISVSGAGLGECEDLSEKKPQCWELTVSGKCVREIETRRIWWLWLRLIYDVVMEIKNISRYREGFIKEVTTVSSH